MVRFAFQQFPNTWKNTFLPKCFYQYRFSFSQFTFEYFFFLIEFSRRNLKQAMVIFKSCLNLLYNLVGKNKLFPMKSLVNCMQFFTNILSGQLRKIREFTYKICPMRIKNCVLRLFYCLQLL